MLAAVTLLTALAPLSARALTIDEVYQYNLEKQRVTSPNTPEMLAYYLLPEVGHTDIQSDNEDIIALAAEITKDCTSDYAKGRAIYDWVGKNIAYDYEYYSDYDVWYEKGGYNVTSFSALGVYLVRKGVCGCITNFTVGLMRAAGLPARGIGGRLGDKDKFEAIKLSGKIDYYRDIEPLASLVSAGGHAWGEFYAEGRWVIIDATWGGDDWFDISMAEMSKTRIIGDYNPTFGVITDETVLKFYGGSSEFTVPDGITEIGDWCFGPSNGLKKVVLPDSVKKIGKRAFNGREELEYVWIPDSVVEIGEWAFWGCPSNLVIYGASGSYAEKYAKQYGIKFIGEPAKVGAVETAGATAAPTNTAFMLNDTAVSLPAYNIANNNYVKLRDVAQLLGGRFDVRWEDNKAKLYDREDYTPVGGELAPIAGAAQTATPSSTDFVWGDSGEAVPGLTAYMINGNNYIKLRDIAQLFDFDADWRDGKAWIEPDEAYTPD
jgi:hypothetical protein